jgi:hypothetical protein
MTGCLALLAQRSLRRRAVVEPRPGPPRPFSCTLKLSLDAYTVTNSTRAAAAPYSTRDSRQRHTSELQFTVGSNGGMATAHPTLRTVNYAHPIIYRNNYTHPISIRPRDSRRESSGTAAREAG